MLTTEGFWLSGNPTVSGTLLCSTATRWGNRADHHRKNQIMETRGCGQRTGVCLGPETRDIHVADNSIEGFAVAIDDQRRL